MRSYRFFAHFNRINMQRGKSEVWTLHVKGQCMQAEEIIFKVPLTTKYRADGPQPRATLRGSCVGVIGSSDGKRLIVI